MEVTSETRNFEEAPGYSPGKDNQQIDIQKGFNNRETKNKTKGKKQKEAQFSHFKSV